MAGDNSARKTRPSEPGQDDSASVRADKATTRGRSRSNAASNSDTDSRRSNAERKGIEEATLEENVKEIKTWELATLQARSSVEQLSDWIAAKAASAPSMLGHLVWFVAWIAINLGWIPGVTPFDRFPFPFLTLTVSLEAIFLALFVLASQNRLARQADRRSHLDLQIDLLAEREMTAVLRLLRDIAKHLDVKTTVTAEQLRDLAKQTDLHKLTDRMEEFTNG
jgi:uncharacterized membrane protein